MASTGSLQHSVGSSAAITEVGRQSSEVRTVGAGRAAVAARHVACAVEDHSEATVARVAVCTAHCAQCLKKQSASMQAVAMTCCETQALEHATTASTSVSWQRCTTVADSQNGARCNLFKHPETCCTCFAGNGRQGHTDAWRAAAVAAEDADAVGVGCRAVVEGAERVALSIQARDVAQAAALCRAHDPLKVFGSTRVDAWPRVPSALQPRERPNIARK